ncbi:LL-diaminopimelate aminotransferase [Nitrospina watsonii]|uniref:LL-diaminopimelate aminotransferase n=1 Tax=Nitrospina watsonii TaxID=1323948 RepID=A0ABM9HEF7_9BACT|nr:LL-diaminopimelate aminotransferase [Nitrospina watsonii]CAI2718587.1 LL-diaminopimelate aminotransferase [Nitrospina watsonii]
MSESYIQSQFADRLGGTQFGKDTKIYKFEKIKRAKRAALEANPGKELFDMGVGEPDEMADAGVIAALEQEARKPENRGYTDNGNDAFKEAAVRYMEKQFGVKGLDPKKHVNHTIGSKPGLAMTPLIFINPGDVTLMTIPGYPVMGTHTQYLGGEVVNLPLTEENGFLPDLKSIDADTARRTKLLYINYPNNPTGANATRKFYEDVVAFAKANDIVVIQDAAYATLTYDTDPISFLSVPGAMDVGVEFHSHSKAYNMTGWRIAFVVGNELVVKGLAHVKDNIDSGQFAAIQNAGIYALEHPEITARIVEKYKRRLRLLVDSLNSVGFKASMPGGSFFLFVKAPKGIQGGPRFDNAEAFSQYLITEHLISTVPWDDVGNYVRFSATFAAKDEAEEVRIMQEIKKRLATVKFEF